MRDKGKTKERLISELAELRRQIGDFRTEETERRKTDEVLRESEKRFRKFFENQPVYCYMISPDGRILDINTLALAVLGYTKKEIVGKPLLTAVYAPSSRKKAKELFTKWKKTGKLQNEELNIMTKIGEERTVLVSADAVRSADGRLLHSISVQRDITELRRTEMKITHLLEETERKTKELSILNEIALAITSTLEMPELLGAIYRRVSNIMKVSTFYIALVDKDSEEMRFEFFIDKGKRVPRFSTKFSEESLTGWIVKSKEPLLIRDMKSENTPVKSKVIGTPTRSWLGVPLIAKGEVIGVMSVQSYEPDEFDEGHLRLMSGIASQVSIALDNSIAYRRLSESQKETKASAAELEKWNFELEDRVREVQEQLLRSERLATIGQLAATVAHELRNPHGVLQNSIYFLNLRLKDADEKVKKHLDTMKKELFKSDKIISDLLDFSRKREPSFAPTDLNGVIEEALSEVTVPERVDVRRNLDHVPTVMADGAQLESVFLNLISNGIQAMPEGGTLTVKTEGKNGFVETKISDTGVGMPNEDLEKIFEPLFTTKSKGIGLGLTITRQLIENHGGTIDVESKPSAGSTFTVRLPIERRGK